MITVSFGQKDGVVYAKFEAGKKSLPCYLKQGKNGKFEVIKSSSEEISSIDFNKKQEIILGEYVSINVEEFVKDQFELLENGKCMSEETSETFNSSSSSPTVNSDKSTDELNKIPSSHTASVTLTPNDLTIANLNAIEKCCRKIKPKDEKGNLLAVQMLLASVILEKLPGDLVNEISIPTDIKLRKIKSSGNIVFTVQNMKLISKDKKEFELKTEIRVEFRKVNQVNIELNDIKISGDNTKLVENCFREDYIYNDLINSDNFKSVNIPVELLSEKSPSRKNSYSKMMATDPLVKPDNTSKRAVFDNLNKVAEPVLKASHEEESIGARWLKKLGNFLLDCMESFKLLMEGMPNTESYSPMPSLTRVFG